MKVERFELKSWISKHTSADMENISSCRLLLNGVLMSDNLPLIEMNKNFLQIDVCEECFHVGCSSQGYVQVFVEGDWIIWKEILYEDFIEERRYDFMSAFSLKYGTIFWPRPLYIELLHSFPERWSDRHLPTVPLNGRQVVDLWRIYGSKMMMPESIDSYSLPRLEENFLTMYSDDGKSEEECRELFKRMKANLHTIEKISMVELPQDTIKYTVMFDYNGHGEWDFLHVAGDKRFCPIGDGLALEINE
jgi:hypothetical protein